MAETNLYALTAPHCLLWAFIPYSRMECTHEVLVPIPRHESCTMRRFMRINVTGRQSLACSFTHLPSRNWFPCICDSISLFSTRFPIRVPSLASMR